MTDTTDIAALLEHNRHIVAYLTRSNPRRSLSSAEVLTLESAKLVVAALSVRDGLPDVDHSEYWFEREGKLFFDGALFNSRVAIFIDSQLEAERQQREAADAALESECYIHIDTMASMREWKQRAEAAEKERDEFKEARKKSSTQWREQFDAVHLRAIKAEAEIAELRAKLANPVVLPSAYGIDAFDSLVERKGEDGFLLYKDEVLEAISAAGFPVKGE